MVEVFALLLDMGLMNGLLQLFNAAGRTSIPIACNILISVVLW
jgi:hypothetical protein